MQKQEVLDTLLTDIKGLYTSLNTKEKKIEEKEYTLLVKLAELEEKERSLEELQERRRRGEDLTPEEIKKRKEQREKAKARQKKRQKQKLPPITDPTAITQSIISTLDNLGMIGSVQPETTTVEAVHQPAYNMEQAPFNPQFYQQQNTPQEQMVQSPSMLQPEQAPAQPVYTAPQPQLQIQPETVPVESPQPVVQPEIVQMEQQPAMPNSYAAQPEMPVYADQTSVIPQANESEALPEQDKTKDRSDFSMFQTSKLKLDTSEFDFISDMIDQL